MEIIAWQHGTRPYSNHETSVNRDKYRSQSNYVTGLRKDSKSQSNYVTGLRKDSKSQSNYVTGLRKDSKSQSNYVTGLRKDSKGRYLYDRSMKAPDGNELWNTMNLFSSSTQDSDAIT